MCRPTVGLDRCGRSASAETTVPLLFPRPASLPSAACWSSAVAVLGSVVFTRLSRHRIRILGPAAGPVRDGRRRVAGLQRTAASIDTDGLHDLDGCRRGGRDDDDPGVPSPAGDRGEHPGRDREPPRHPSHAHPPPHTLSERAGPRSHPLRPPRRPISDEPSAATAAIPDRNAPPHTALANASCSPASQTWKTSTITRNAT